MELPRVDASELSYKQFLLEFALPGQPCIMYNCRMKSPAANAWDPQALLLRKDVDLSHEVSLTVGSLAGDAAAPPERQSTVGESLQLLADRLASPTQRTGPPVYLAAWDYVRGGSQALKEDFTVPTFFERSPAWLANHVVLGNAATDMQWLYLGEEGSGSATHVDTNASSAWLWVARGRKRWRCLHARDCEAVQALGECTADGEGLVLPDLFSDDVLERLPAGMCVYVGEQHAGEVCFNPSRCVHAVRNDAFTVSLTHNFIDATNLSAAIADAVASMRTELLPMVAELSPKRVLKTLHRSLRVSKAQLSDTLRALPSLLDHLDDVVDAAVAHELDDVHKQECAEVLHAHLHEGLRDIREVFRKTSEELVAVLELT